MTQDKLTELLGKKDNTRRRKITLHPSEKQVIVTANKAGRFGSMLQTKGAFEKLGFILTDDEFKKITGFTIRRV